MTTTLKIKSTHSTLSEAVRAANIDLSYNKLDALNRIKAIDCPTPRHQREGSKGTQKAFVVEGGEVLYIYKCDILVLNKFEPFTSCLHNDNFHLVNIGENEIVISDITFDKNPVTRRIIALQNLIVA